MWGSEARKTHLLIMISFGQERLLSADRLRRLGEVDDTTEVGSHAWARPPPRPGVACPALALGPPHQSSQLRAAARPGEAHAAACVDLPCTYVRCCPLPWVALPSACACPAGRTGTVDWPRPAGAACGHCTGRLLRTGRQTVAISGKNLPRHFWRSVVSLWMDPRRPSTTIE